MASSGLPSQEDINVDIEDLSGRNTGKVAKRKLTPLPKVQLSVLLYMHMAEPVITHVMLPFIVQLIKETGITGGDVTKLGYYTGLADSLFYLAEALTILQWGRLSDHIGRRPVLFAGLFGLAFSILFFGLSHSFWAVIFSRALAGLLNGNKGVTKSVIGELSDPTNMAQAFALEPLTWSAGGAISPLIGGTLQHPYERLGRVFHTEFWRHNPYFLPCFVTALVSFSAVTLGFFFLKETAPCKTHRTTADNVSTSETTPLISAFPHSPSPPPLSSLLTPRVILVLTTYGLLGLTDVSFYTLQPLILSTPIEYGGLGLQPSTIGNTLAAFAFVRGMVIALSFAPLTRRFGEKGLATVCVAAFIVCYTLFPVMNGLARAEGGVTWIVWTAIGLQLAFATLPDMGYACVFLYVNASTPNPSALGAINGLAQTTVSLMRILGPASTSSLFALSIGRNLMGGAMVYLVMCTLAGLTCGVMRMLPASPWERQ